SQSAKISGWKPLSLRNQLAGAESAGLRVKLRYRDASVVRAKARTNRSSVHSAIGTIGLAEAVADAPDRFNHVGGLTKLLSQRSNVYVDRSL
ncbi:MAG: hypothetical protein ACI87E_002498, partial [Mariniblastus sp.]